MSKKILLIDGTWLTFKSFFGGFYGNRLVNSKGDITFAIHIFFSSVFKLIRIIKPDNIYFAFDYGSKTPRHQDYPDYKKGRAKPPDALLLQMKQIKKILSLANFLWSQHKDFEADDLIASLQKKIRETDPEAEIIIFSSDQDLLQLIDRKTIIINKIENNFINTQTVDNFFEKHGFHPDQVVDFKVLAGDASDNIKVIDGLGKKGAIKLLEKYKNLDNIFSNLDKINNKIAKQINEKKPKLLFFKDFIKLNQNANFDFDIFQKLKIKTSPALVEILKELELKKVHDALNEIATS
ncbi:5'-3' exonuclease [Mesomycoplasma flocculare]|uniref:5'-3' exonuclease n=1 Tax=Mesomycoplasma flocculare TaxID=2128 RepID=UPI00136DED9B|nr:5'-3' exonuclease [Mesomycoplasma flocculare]MXR23014.1 5'-3' exonuclease [Mesomycoplasma flocculare]